MSNGFKFLVFVDPQKFSSLLTNPISEKIGFHRNEVFNGNTRPIYLENDQHLVYINEDNVEVGAFDNEKSILARIIIFPDNYNMDTINYIPDVDFKIIHHSGTIEKKYKPFQSNPKHKYTVKCLENSGTLYDEIATIIKKRMVE